MTKKILMAALIFSIPLLLPDSNSASANQITARIIGGNTAEANDWPWMAGLINKQTPISYGSFCGATLIAKDWVLTAAHCVIDNSSSNIDVLINQDQLDKQDGERIAASRIIIHPEYDDVSLENDLALIKLAKPSKIQPIMILPPFSTQDKSNTPAIALGWGSISAFYPLYPLDLQQVTLPIVSNALCAKSMGNITDDILCAGVEQGNKDTCFGDSGGPLIVFDTESRTWRQAGITSWGFGCAVPDFYGVYTRLKNYAGFISEHICSSNEKPPEVTLKLNIDGNIATANWNALNDVSGYRLTYAPYPDAHTLYSIDLNHDTVFSALLENGSAYYVAISSYNNNCISDYSNIEHFTIN